MKIAILGPINSKNLYPLIKKKKLKFLPKGHGVSHLPNLAKGLLKLGYQVSLITLSDDISKNKIIFLKNKKLKIYFCPLRKNLFRLGGILCGQEINNLKNAIEKDNPDIVHANWIYEYAFAASNSKKKYVLTNHDIPHVILKYQKNIFRLIRFFMGYISLKRAKTIITPSKYAKLQTSKYTNNSISVISNTSLSKDLFNSKIKQKKINKKINIVMLNNGFTPFKNIKIALKAFKEFNKFSPDSYLNLIGHGMEKDSICYKWAKESSLTKNVIFIGHLEHTYLMKVFHKYDVLLHTSLEETFGNIYIEAMIKGVPIIAGKKSGATPEIIKNNGLLVDVKNCKQIVNALKKYLQNPTLWKKIRYRAYNHIKLNYSNKILVRKHLLIYKKTLKKSNG
tara:strand:+ start:1130 stop:2311 length:1182 start_codon:yes stop_codon:yes gene_type:complete